MRYTGLLAVGAAGVLYVGVHLARRYGLDGAVPGLTLEPATLLAVALVSTLLGLYGVYRVALTYLLDHTESKRRQHDVRNVLRLAVGAVGIVVVFGVVTRNWVSVLFSLGVLGFAVTFALQQPLFSLIGWVYVMVKRPYRVGDRIAIGETRGDVVSIDFFVTEIWEIDGELVASNQPSGRIVTVPNSTVLSSHVVNFYGDGVQYVWNEVSIQVAYETDLAFTTDLMVDVATDLLGDDMRDHVREYRDRLAETPVELDVTEQPTVNVVQRESWVELRLRYIVHPRRGTRARNALYEGILERLNEHPDRVKFPATRSR
jgi:small-conductance mechanosensitive channel